MINLSKCPFLSLAYKYIEKHPGCCKREVILNTYFNGRMPNDTYAYRNKAIDRLIDEGLVKNTSKNHIYSLRKV